MLIVMKETATLAEVEGALSRVTAMGGVAECHRPREAVIVVRPDDLDARLLAALPGVDRIEGPGPGYWLASRRRRAEDTVVEVRGRRIGGDSPPVLIAGPCAVESEDQLLRAVEAAVEAGAQLLRGGAYKPRTSPYSFQGLGEEGLELLARVRERFDIPVVTELRDVGTLGLFLDYQVDMLQIGARNMQNFELLRAAGQSGIPVLLKRGPAASVEEWLMAAEYVMLSGNPNVVLCERGILPPSTVATRYQLDIAAIPIARALSHLPVIADPSHAAGAREYVLPLAEAAIAAGAQGLLVEIHADPCQALCDGRQALTPPMARELMDRLRRHRYVPPLPSPVARGASWGPSAEPAVAASARGLRH